MKTAALNIYVCPACKHGLRLTPDRWQRREVLDGTLICISCEATYAVRNGVPRFSSSDLTGRVAQGPCLRVIPHETLAHTHECGAVLRQTTGWADEAFAGRLVLDVGLGLEMLTHRAAAFGARVFGIDGSDDITATFDRIGHGEHVHLAQADVLALPFRDLTFDLAYSIGLVHRRTDRTAAFARVAATVKACGQLAVHAPTSAYADVAAMFRENRYQHIDQFDGPIRIRGIKAADITSHGSDHICRLVAS